MRQRVFAWGALLSAMLTFGCGGSDQRQPVGQAKGGAAPATAASTGPLDACKLLSQIEIAEAVGNPVTPGQHFAGSEVCKWDTEQREHVSVLLTVRPKGSLREQTLCKDLKSTGTGAPLDGVGDVALWQFSKVGTMFNSGDLESCGPKGYVSLSLNGEHDEPALKQATLAIVGKVLGRI